MLASTDFNKHPVQLTISGTCETHPGLFALLEGSQNPNEAHDMFVHYLNIAFGLRKPTAHDLSVMGKSEQRRWKSSWRKLLQGWGMDSNGVAGAVLKGWAESRFRLGSKFSQSTAGTLLVSGLD